MKLRTVILALAFVTLVGLTITKAQTNKTYTYSFNHDGVNTDGYSQTIDGTRTVITPTCSGTPRVCTGTLTMTQNVNHTVTFGAFNTFGESLATPFSAAPPAGAISGVSIR